MAETDQTLEQETETGEAGAQSGLPEPTITLEDAGPARKKLSIEIPAEAIAAKLGENFDTLRDEAAIPGFRRGHAPQRLLEKRFGAEVRKDVCSQLVGESYTSAIEKHNLRVLGEPQIKDVEDLKLPDDGPLSVEIEVEVVPEVKLPDLKGMEVKKPLFEVTDAQVEKEIARYGEMYGQFKPVAEAQAEDYIGADVTVRNSEEEVVQEFKGTELLVPGERRNFKGVVAGIVVEDLGKRLEGVKAGETVTLKVTGPERHENEKIAGQEVTLELAVSRVQRLHPMAATELVAAMGLESEEALKEQVRTSLDARAKTEQQHAMQQQVVDQLLERVEMELPERLSTRQAGSILQRRGMDLMQRGASREDIDQNLADLRTASEQQAQSELKRLFVLDAVARELEVEVSEAEVNGRIVQIAAHQGVRPERLREQLAQSGQLDQLYIQLREHKAVAKVLADATVTEVSAEDWRKTQGQDEEGEEAKPKAGKKKSGKKAKKETEQE